MAPRTNSIGIAPINVLTHNIFIGAVFVSKEDTMKRIIISQLKDHVGKEVTIKAIVDVSRNQGKMAFFDFRDYTGKIQGVVFGKPELLEKAQQLKQEYAVAVTGIVNQRPDKMIKHDVENGDIELEITEITVLNQSEALPFDRDAQLNIDTYLDYLPLTLRTKRGQDIFKLQATIIGTFRDALRNNDFVEFQNPALVGGDAEGGAGVFEVPYFHNKTAYLATSPQFYKQIMVGVHERVFTTARVFRAEKHATTRHLNEYITLDFEFGFVEDHTSVMEVHEQVIKSIVNTVMEKHSDILKSFDAEIPLVPDSFPRMKLREAQKLIHEQTGVDKTREPDLEPEDERWLCEYARKNLNSDFIYITHYPVSKRPFYTYEDEDDPGYTKSFDLLFKGVEITTGGQRIHDYQKLTVNVQKWGLDPEKFSFYLQAFKYGIPPHGGSATGLERITQKFLNLANVKEATLFPRDINRIDTRLSEVEGSEED